jgi:hypothetical protein
MVRFAWYILLRILLSVNGYQIMNQSRVTNVDEQTERYSVLLETCSKDDLNVSP